jgi:hypothetical protein
MDLLLMADIMLQFDPEERSPELSSWFVRKSETLLPVLDRLSLTRHINPPTQPGWSNVKASGM